MIQETLDTKLPALLEQFPGMDETFVRTVAQADPTGCQYVDWLLRSLRENQWSITDAASMHTILEAFDHLTKSPQWAGQTDINAYTSLDGLVNDINQHVEAHKIPNDESPNPVPEGAKQIASRDTAEVWEITTPQAATLFAHGQAPSPRTQWPTINQKIAAKYLVDGPLYVVLQNNQPVAQIHFGRHEAKNEHNLNLTSGEALKIAALFTGQSFATELGTIPYRPGGWQLGDEDIEQYLKRLKAKFIAQRKAGFYLGGQWIEPIGDEALLERRWKAKEPEFRHALKLAQKDRDEEVISKAGRRHPQPVGMQALANAVYDLEHA